MAASRSERCAPQTAWYKSAKELVKGTTWSDPVVCPAAEHGGYPKYSDIQEFWYIMEKGGEVRKLNWADNELRWIPVMWNNSFPYFFFDEIATEKGVASMCRDELRRYILDRFWDDLTPDKRIAPFQHIFETAKQIEKTKQPAPQNLRYLRGTCFYLRYLDPEMVLRQRNKTMYDYTPSAAASSSTHASQSPISPPTTEQGERARSRVSDNGTSVANMSGAPGGAGASGAPGGAGAGGAGAGSAAASGAVAGGAVAGGASPPRPTTNVPLAEQQAAAAAQAAAGGAVAGGAVAGGAVAGGASNNAARARQARIDRRARLGDAIHPLNCPPGPVDPVACSRA